MFDINNYTEKTKTITITDPNQIITLGDDYDGGQYVDCFSATGLSIKKDGVSLINGKNFTLPTADKQLKEYYGQNFYSQIQLLGVTGELEITYRKYGTYTDDNIINRHETRLNEHDTSIDDVETSLTNIESTVAGFDNRVTTAESNIEAAQTSITDIDSRLTLAEDDIDTAQSDIASLQDNALLKTANDYSGISSETPADEDLFIFEDTSDGGAKKKCPRSALTASSGAGSGDVISDVSSSTVGNIVIINGTNGKHITDSGIPSTGLVHSDSTSASIGHIPVISNADGKHISTSGYPLFYPGEIKWFDDYIGASTTFPFLCLADADTVLSASNWPQLVPYLRNKTLKYMPGTANTQTQFNVVGWSVASNVGTVTFANTTPEIKILSALAEDNLVHGSFTNWRTITFSAPYAGIPAGTYAITALNTTNRTITFAVTAPNGSGTTVALDSVLFCPHRLADSIDTTGTQARHFQMSGRTLVSINDTVGECIAGLRRRDRMQPITGTIMCGAVGRDTGTVVSYSGSLTAGSYDIRSSSTASGAGLGLGSISINSALQTRTGYTTDPRALVAVPYLCGGSYVA